MKLKSIFLLALSFFLTFNNFTYTVHPAHPRIFLTTDDLPRLRARCGIEDGDNRTKYPDEWGSHREEYVDLVDHRGEHVLPNAFLYLMTGDASYADEAIKHMASAEQHDLAIAFDWIYDALDESRKQAFGNMIIDYADDQNAYDYHATNGTAKNDGYLWRLLPWAGLALYNEGINDAKAAAYLDRARYWFYEADNATISNWEYVGNDGAGYQGNYDWNGLMGSLDMGIAWDTGTDENLLADFDRLKNTGWWYLFILRAGGGQWDHFEALPSGDGFVSFYRPMRTLLYRCASFHKDPRAQTFGDLMSTAGGNYIPYQKHMYWKEILWHDKTVPIVNLHTLPGTRFFDSLGRIVMRTGWDLRKAGTNTDIWADFRCEKYAHVHTHLHQNHFTISRGIDQLALDSGGYDNYPGDHRQNYYHLTVAHNSILIGGDQRKMGRPPRNLKELKNEHYNRGFIERYGHEDPGYTYGMGDATKAYPPEKASNFTRQFVFLNHRYFVVFDRVSVTDPSHEMAWLLHTVNEPAIEDEGHWRAPEFGFSNSREGGKKSSEDTRVLSASVGSSKIYLSILQPASVLVSKIGGSNAKGKYNQPDSYEFWHNGANHPADDLNHVTTPNMGRWRIEARPGTAARDHIFLTVLQPCAGSASWVDNTFIRGNIGQGNKEMYGAHIKDAGEPCLALFARDESKNGGLIDEVTFSVNDTGTLHVLVCDMAPETYHIYRDGEEIGDSPKMVVSGNNTLYFRVEGGGDLHVTVRGPESDGK